MLFRLGYIGKILNCLTRISWNYFYGKYFQEITTKMTKKKINKEVESEAGKAFIIN